MREKLPRELRDMIYEHIIEGKQLSLDVLEGMGLKATAAEHEGPRDLYSCDCYCGSCKTFFDTGIAGERVQDIVELRRPLGLSSISDTSRVSVPGRRDRQAAFPRHIFDTNRLAEDVLVELAEVYYRTVSFTARGRSSLAPFRLNNLFGLQLPPAEMVHKLNITIDDKQLLGNPTEESFRARWYTHIPDICFARHLAGQLEHLSKFGTQCRLTLLITAWPIRLKKST
jgi:hypothetical protein